jgi:hypothetical protein
MAAATQTPDGLVDLLRIRGPLRAREVLAALDVSQPTLSRLARAAGTRLVRIGKARRTTYAVTREIRTFGSAWPLYRVDPAGSLHASGTLHALQPRSWWYAATPMPGWLQGEFSDGIFPDLPWFVDDLRPQGFLGRAFARRHAASLAVGEDPRLWDADGVLAALLLYGDDLPGSWVVGEAAAERVQRRVLGRLDAIPAGDRAARYEALAADALAGDVGGSSAGGEQPKFAAYAEDRDGIARHVLVKFSPPLDSPSGRRWADLLRAEHLAGVTLRSAGLAACRTEWMAGPTRALLEVVRFDRVGMHGRRPVVSLLALEAAHYGALDTWTAAADRLERDGWLAPGDAETLRVLWWFGRLIANTDMHFANVSLMLDATRPLTMAPAYDMLPMQYRPTAAGEIVDTPFDVALPLPQQRATWSRAARMAIGFWERVADDPHVSAGLRDAVAGNRAAVADAARRIAP